MRKWARGWAEDEAPRHDYFQRTLPNGRADPFDESDKDWGFTWDAQLVKLGYTIMRNSDFAVIPTPDDLEQLLRYPGWLEDLMRCHRLVRFWSEKHPILDNMVWPTLDLADGDVKRGR